jgi:hypothetical protein
MTMPQSDNSARKDEIAKRIADKYLHRFVAAFNVGGHHEREHQRLTAMLLEALTSYEDELTPSGEGWQQRIAALRKHQCSSCDMTDEEWAEVRGWTNAINAVLELIAGQNAKDATPQPRADGGSRRRTGPAPWRA